MSDLPGPCSLWSDAALTSIPAPADRPFPGRIGLHVDVTDVERRIFDVRETIPVVCAGPMVLLFPEWLPGYHSPQAPIELLAGLTFTADDTKLRWTRHPVNVHAFMVDVPAGVTEIVAGFQFLSPTDPSQGRVVVGSAMLMLQWNTVILYPAGHHASSIEVAPRLRLPVGWAYGCALRGVADRCSTLCFEAVSLDVLVDSPVLAGRHTRRCILDEDAAVELLVAADSEDLLAITPDGLAPHRALVEQADRLFGKRHFDRYTMLLALTDELDSNGVEHHRCCEAISVPGYFRDWDAVFSRRDTLPHEFIHRWNGKHLRGSDSATTSFDQPIRNSLMWVYEGQTQYWDRVLCARSGLWTREQALAALAVTAAIQDVRAGSRWRPMSDTTRDPIIAARAPLPWPSWQRSEDYYSEGSLLWMDVDTRIRDLSGGERSLDDFARTFFGAGEAGDWSTRTYVFDDVVAALEAQAEFDWRALLTDHVCGTHQGPPLDGIERGGYRLVYRERPTDYMANLEQLSGVADLTFSLGLKVDRAGRIVDVLWESPAFTAALTSGWSIVGVGGMQFSIETLKEAVEARQQIALAMENKSRSRTVTIDYCGGPRYPWLDPIGDAPRLLDAVLASRGSR
ncbi:peptidase M61 [Sphingomonas spermidinifaciens]|uniref:Peptidase M61 n=1 Tax=Sphingomonas spermidinifaciens TaxID=1141889 RepID=A0A2A4B1G0_9SPHN|nr:M61 family metallopeptidase [Sphingomonas spermidinifaciens]PCD01795.1 peptidase M61 [Sphingomonas spermidinifaciens]